MYLYWKRERNDEEIYEKKEIHYNYYLSKHFPNHSYLRLLTSLKEILKKKTQSFEADCDRGLVHFTTLQTTDSHTQIHLNTLFTACTLAFFSSLEIFSLNCLRALFWFEMVGWCNTTCVLQTAELSKHHLFIEYK